MHGAHTTHGATTHVGNVDSAGAHSVCQPTWSWGPAQRSGWAAFTTSAIDARHPAHLSALDLHDDATGTRLAPWVSVWATSHSGILRLFPVTQRKGGVVLVSNMVVSLVALDDGGTDDPQLAIQLDPVTPGAVGGTSVQLLVVRTVRKWCGVNGRASSHSDPPPL